MATAIHDGPEAVAAFLDKYPDMVREREGGERGGIYIER